MKIGTPSATGDSASGKTTRFFAGEDSCDTMGESARPVAGTDGESVFFIPDDGGLPSVSVKIRERAAVAGVNPVVGFPRSKRTVATPDKSVIGLAGELIGMSPVFPAETLGELATAVSITGGAKIPGEIIASGIGVKSHLTCGIGRVGAGLLPALSAPVLPASFFVLDGAAKGAGWPDFALAGW